MKTRGLYIALAVFIALAGLLYWSNHRKPADSAQLNANTAPPVLKLDQAAITRIELKKRNTEPVVLTKNSAGDWQIIEPQQLRADQSTVASLASALAPLNSDSVVEDRSTDLKSYGLDQPALEVDVTERDSKSQKVLIGDDAPAGSSAYAILAGDPRLFTIASYTKTALDKGLNDLRDKRLLTVSADKVSRIELLRKNEDIEFGRNKDEWQILTPRPLRADGTAVGNLVRELTDAKMDTGNSDSEKAENDFAHATPVATARVTDESGTQELQLRKHKDDYYAKSSATAGACKVDASLGKALDKGLDDFRNKKLFDFGYNNPNKIELHNGNKSYALVRGTGGYDDWWSNGKKMDRESAQAVITRLRDLSASRFPESGFTAAAIEALVISGDGKRTEKVQIAKSGDHYIARRENEPALYQLDASAVDDLLKAADGVKPASVPAK